MASFTVRRADPRELYEAIIALWQRAGLPFEPEGRDSRKALARQLQLGTHWIFVAEAEGRLIGTVIATHDGRKGWINRLAVDPRYRRRSVAQALVQAAEEAFREAGLTIVATLVEGDNEASHALFRKMGYEERRDIVYYRKIFRRRR